MSGGRDAAWDDVPASGTEGRRPAYVRRFAYVADKVAAPRKKENGLCLRYVDALGCAAVAAGTRSPPVMVLRHTVAGSGGVWLGG